MTVSPNPSPDQWTIRRVLEWTKRHLAEHGSESPRLDAEILLAHARGCPRIQLYTHFDDVLDEQVRSRMRDLVKRRARREPVAYLVGHREFFSLEFEVNREVLIPRPETELLVVEALDAVRGLDAPRVLDVGTGCGCIAIAVAVNAPAARVTAVDISEGALAVARHNAERHNVSDRIEFRKGDLFAPLSAEPPFDVIVSNPPYVATADSGRLPPDVERHEPEAALFAGADGLDTIRRIIDDAPPHLKIGGVLLIEFSPEQADRIAELIASAGVFERTAILRDLNRSPRAVRTVRRTREE